jgi:AraC-like DNA-binding protein
MSDERSMCSITLLSGKKKAFHLPMTHHSKQQLEEGINRYLLYCYDKRTAARATELAAFLGVNYRNLTRLCHRFLGAPARAALRSRQLSYAAGLLRESTTSIDEIGMMAGFGDRRTFYRAIRRQFGCSPMLLRNAVLNCP